MTALRCLSCSYLGIALFALACSSSSTRAQSSGDGGTTPHGDASLSDGGQPTDAAKHDALVAHEGGEPSDAGVDQSAPPSDAGAGLTAVGTGEYVTYYLKDGVIYGYGASSTLLGQGSYDGLTIPPRAIASPAGVKFIAVQGGLHQSMAIDTTHHLWTWGEVDQGLQGSGSDAGNGAIPYEVTTDATGNAFDNIVWIEPTVSSSQGEMMYDVAVKSDGTVWVWGNLTGGLSGDGTAGGSCRSPPKSCCRSRPA